MGGDNAPDIVIKGASDALKANRNLFFNFFGDESQIKNLIKQNNIKPSNYKIFHTIHKISSDEKPSVALRKGIKSSMRLAINSVKSGESEAVVSAGNTGALMAMSKIVLRPLESIDRPAIVSFLPNKKGGATVMLDMGANIECNSDILYQFAIMGHAFAKIALKIDNPKIGLLNVGSEDLKGSDAVKSAALLIKDSQIADNFYGYVEGDDIAKGTVDVVVTDGFSGNITLKAIEGTAKMISSYLKEGFKRTIFSKIGYLLAKKSLNSVFKKIDPNLYNGAMLVGLNGIAVKSHGGASHVGFCNAIKVASSLVENDINQNILQEVRSSTSEEDFEEGFMFNSKIIATGAYLPEKIITNYDLEKVIDTTNEWIVERTGILKRHIVTNELTSDISAKAANNALKNANINVLDIDMIIVATTTPDLTFPSTATIIQSKIGAKNAFAFDVQAVCSGFVYALSVANNFIKTGQAGNILVIGADTLSKIVDWQDRNTCVLFGDGAGAVILSATNNKNEGILSSHLASDGNLVDILKTSGGVGLAKNTGYIEMSGREVFKHAVEKMSDCVIKSLTSANLNIENIDLLIPHQANIRILNSVAKTKTTSGKGNSNSSRSR